MFEGMSRRSFVKALAASAMSSSAINSGLGQDRVAASGEPTEWSYTSGKQYSDPFNQVDVDAIITLPSGQQERMPAFWAGGSDMARALRSARAWALPYSIGLQRHRKQRPS